MFKFLTCLLLLLTLSIPSEIFGQKLEPRVSGGQVNEALTNMPQPRFLPGNPIYYLIRTKEIFGRFFNASAVDRAQFDIMISSKRLKEIYLLVQVGKFEKATRLRDDYSGSLEKSMDQLIKARAQNQEAAPIVDEITDELNYQDTLIIHIGDDINDQSAQDFDTVYLSDSFDKYVSELEQFKPGIRSRFKLLREINITPEETVTPSPSPIIYSSTSSAKPKRIIY